MIDQRCLYVFIDESGDFTFSDKGTTHVMLSAVYTEDPWRSAAVLQELKYDLLAARSDDLEFHATVNSKGTRKRVAAAIRTLTDVISVHTVWLDKHYAHPSLQSKVSMMALLGKALGTYICKAIATDQHDSVVLVFDSVLTGKEQQAFKAEVKPRLKQVGVPFHLAFHPVKSDLNGQIADYFSWSWFRWVEQGDKGPIGELRGITWRRFNAFKNGNTKWW